MSFFDDTKTVGNIFLVIGIISIVSGILCLFIDGDEFTDEVQTSGIILLIASLINAAIFVIYGLDVKKGSARFHIGRFFDDFGSKYGVLCGMVAVIGVTDLISGICTVSVLNVVIAVVILIMAYLMTDDKKGLSDKIIWVILVIFTILMLIAGLILLLAIIGIVYILLAITVLCFLFSPDVKERMGV